jgi:hypothetical protein
MKRVGTPVAKRRRVNRRALTRQAANHEWLFLDTTRRMAEPNLHLQPDPTDPTTKHETDP